MYCTKCGSWMEDYEQFCQACGADAHQNTTEKQSSPMKPKKQATGKMMLCKSCGERIAVKARTCPYCGAKNKKPLYKRGWFIAVCVIVILAAFGSTGNPSSNNVINENSTDIQISETVNSNDKNTTQSDKSNDVVKDAPSKEEQAPTQKPETAISYETVDIQAMLDELDANALRAERTYQDKYIEVSGKLCGVDSDGV